MKSTQNERRSLNTAVSPILTGFDKLIDEAQQQAQALRAAQVPGRRRGDQEEDATPPHTLDDLDLFIGRLRQVKEWLQQDPHLLQVVDDHMNQQIRAMEKRQSIRSVWLTITTTLIGALLGWFTSALASPVTLWHLLFH